MWIEEVARLRQCRLCGAEIVSAKTKADKTSPLNARSEILRIQQIDPADIASVATSASHFATCPQLTFEDYLAYAKACYSRNHQSYARKMELSKTSDDKVREWMRRQVDNGSGEKESGGG